MKLLIVEDDRMLSELLRRALIEDGYAVDVAFDGEQAEALAFVNEYDAIVLDLLLPGKSGLHLLQQMRRENRLTPTLILTGRATKEDVVRGLDVGADDYLNHIACIASRVQQSRDLFTRCDQTSEQISILRYRNVRPVRRQRALVLRLIAGRVQDRERYPEQLSNECPRGGVAALAACRPVRLR